MSESNTPPNPGAEDPLAAARSAAERELMASQAPAVPPDDGSGGLPPAASMGTGPGSDERLVAAIAHILAFLSWFWVPLLLNGIIFLGWRDRSRYVAFQSAQAFVYNIALAVASWMLVAVVLGNIFLICLLPLAFALVVCGYLYALWGAFQTATGQDFSYLVVGPLVADYLERHAA